MTSKTISLPSKTSAFPEENVGKILFRRLNSFDKNAVAFVEIKTDQTCTYGELTSRSLSLAANLRNSLGVVKNDHLCIISENSHKFWVALIAGLCLGAPIHLLSPSYTIYELKKCLSLSKPKVVFCSEQVLPKLTELKLECPFIEVLVLLDGTDLSGDSLSYEDLTTTSDVDFEFEEISEINSHVAIIVNSSGTTGPPKGVMLSHGTLRLNLSHVEDEELYPFYDNTVNINVVPFCHVHGFGISFCGLYQGAKYLNMTQFVPDLYLQLIPKYKVIKLFIVPTMADFLAKSPLVGRYDLSSIKEIHSAAGVIKEATYKKILQKFNLKTIRQVYGMTEVGTAVFITPPSSNNHGSCGKVAPGVSVKIVDQQTGEVLRCNQSGEILVKSTHMIGYINNPDSTRAAFDSEGFLKSGDIGYYDEDHFFYIVDRIKDLIKYKSFQVPPLEIEEILMKHPGVGDVAVVGKPSERYGELAVAFVVRKGGVGVTEKEVVEFLAKFVCLEKQLHGGVVFVEEIPRNAIGKILRKELRGLLEEE